MNGTDSASGGKSEGRDANRIVVVTRIAKDEGKDILTEFQYLYVKDIVERLADFGDKVATADLDIAPFGDFWELKLKGGPLKRLNLRIYCADIPEEKTIVVLKTYKKEEDRLVSPSVMITLEDRLDSYRSGETRGISVFRHLGR